MNQPNLLLFGIAATLQKTWIKVLASATRYAAECMGIDETLGILELHKTADFIVVENNLLEDKLNSQEIYGVFIAFTQVL